MADIPTCVECGQPHVTPRGGVACRGHVVYDRDSYVKGQKRKPLPEPRPCQRPPLTEQRVCAAHGGNAPQNRAAAAVRSTVADAQAALAHEGIGTVDDPLAEVNFLVLEAKALKLAFAARVNALDHIRYTGGLEHDEDGELRGTGTEQLRAEVAAYERQMDRQMRFLEVLLKHTTGGNVDHAKAMMTRIGEALGISE